MNHFAFISATKDEGDLKVQQTKWCAFKLKLGDLETNERVEAL